VKDVSHKPNPHFLYRWCRDEHNNDFLRHLETTIPSYITVRPSRDLLRFRNQQLTREWWKNRSQSHALSTSQLVLDEAALAVAANAAERLAVLGHAVLFDTIPKLADEVRGYMTTLGLDVSAVNAMSSGP